MINRTLSLLLLTFLLASCGTYTHVATLTKPEAPLKFDLTKSEFLQNDIKSETTTTTNTDKRGHKSTFKTSKQEYNYGLASFYKKKNTLYMKLVGRTRWSANNNGGTEMEGSSVYKVVKTSENEFLVQMVKKNGRTRAYKGSLSNPTKWEKSKMGKWSKRQRKPAAAEMKLVIRYSINSNGKVLTNEFGQIYNIVKKK